MRGRSRQCALDNASGSSGSGFVNSIEEKRKRVLSAYLMVATAYTTACRDTHTRVWVKIVCSAYGVVFAVARLKMKK